MYRPYPGHNDFYVFKGLFLDVPWAILFHATAKNCQHGMDIGDASFFVLECVLQVNPKFKVQVSQRRMRNAQASQVVTKKVV